MVTKELIEHWAKELKAVQEQRDNEVVLKIVARDLWDALMEQMPNSDSFRWVDDGEVERRDGVRIRVSDYLPDGYGYDVTRKAMEEAQGVAYPKYKGVLPPG